MAVINNTRYKDMWLVGKNQEEVLVVIVKGTFDIINGSSCKLAENQLDILAIDEHYGEMDKTSCKFESDLVLYKPKCDIVVIGKAYAPGGVATEQCDISISINGNIGSVIRVFGDRHWIYSGGAVTMSAIAPFTEIDIKFENAFGGKDYYKYPVGTGYVENIEATHNLKLPNLEDPNNLITTWNTQPQPMCWGFYGKGWQPRLEKAGTYDQGWLDNISPELPFDFNWEFNNGAMPDLIMDCLNGDETITFINCDSTGSYSFTLPNVTLQVAVDFGSGEEKIPMVLDALCVMIEENQIYLVWRGQVSCQVRLDSLKTIKIDEV